MQDGQVRWRGLVALLVIYVTVAHVVPRPWVVEPAGWRLLGIFLVTVAGLILRPIPGGAVVLLGVTLSA